MLRSSPICLFVTEYPTNRYFCISTNWYLYICVNFFFLSEDRKWWEPLQQFVWPNICNWLCILGIHAKISKRWKDHAFKVVQAWFNFEATKTRESLMKCEMSTNVRKNAVSLRKIQGKAPRNYFCKLPDMFSVTETNGCTREQSQADCEHILFQYITVWQCVTLSSLSVMINSAGGPCPCLRTGPLYYCDSCKPILKVQGPWGPVEDPLGSATLKRQPAYEPVPEEQQHCSPLWDRDGEANLLKGLRPDAESYCVYGHRELEPSWKKTQLLITRQISPLSHTSS